MIIRAQETASNAAVALAAFLVLAASLSPSGDLIQSDQLCLLCADAPVSDYVLNVLLYVPLGLALAVRTGSIAKTAGIGLVLSLVVEAAQMWIPGRFATAVDIVFNVTGVYVGAIVTARRATWVTPGQGQRSALLASATLLTGGLVVGSCFLLTPSLPGGVLYVGLTPDLGGHAQYPSRVAAAFLGSLALTGGVLEPRGRDLLAENAPLEVTIPVARTPIVAPLVQITAGDLGEALMMGVRRNDVVVRRRRLAEHWGMQSAEIVFASSLSDLQGDTVALKLAIDRAGRHVLFLDGAQAASRGVTSARIWTLWYSPSDMREAVMVLVDLLWTAMLLAPIGFWSRSYVQAAAVGSIPLAVSWLAPLSTAALAPPPTYMAWALACLAAGHWSAAWLARARPDTGGRSVPA